MTVSYTHLDVYKRQEQYRTNPVLGYRTAGSRAELETGGMLVREMESLGLADVHKDRITVDLSLIHI